MAILLAAIVVLVLVCLWDAFRPTRGTSAPRRSARYPRIVDEGGVWVAEIDGFDRAVVEMAPGVYREMQTEEARRIVEGGAP